MGQLPSGQKCKNNNPHGDEQSNPRMARRKLAQRPKWLNPWRAGNVSVLCYACVEIGHKKVNCHYRLRMGHLPVTRLDAWTARNPQCPPSARRSAVLGAAPALDKLMLDCLSPCRLLIFLLPIDLEAAPSLRLDTPALVMSGWVQHRLS